MAKAVNSKEKIAIKRMCHEGDKEMRNNADEIVHLKKVKQRQLLWFT